MQFKSIVAVIASSAIVNALPAADSTDASFIEARADHDAQVAHHMSAIDAAALQLQQAKVNFDSAKLDAAKALISMGEKAGQAGHVAMQPGELEAAKDIVARAEQTNQAEAAKAGQQGAQNKQAWGPCWIPAYCGYGSQAYSGAYAQGSGLGVNLLGLLNVGAGQYSYGYGTGYGYI